MISGLESGYVAVYTKIHHAVIDGVSGAEITGLLLDVSPMPSAVEPPRYTVAPRHPSAAELWGRALLGIPRSQARMLRSLPRALPNLNETTISALPGVGGASRLAGGCNASLPAGA